MLLERTVPGVLHCSCDGSIDLQGGAGPDRGTWPQVEDEAYLVIKYNLQLVTSSPFYSVVLLASEWTGVVTLV